MTGLYGPRNSPGQNAEVDSLSLLQEIFQIGKGSGQGFKLSARDRTQVSRIAGGFFTNWAIREDHALKKINSEYSLEGLMVKVKFQYFGHLMQRAYSLEKTLMLGNIESSTRGGQRIRWLMASLTQWTWVWASSRRWWRTGKPRVLQSMGLQGVRHDWVIEEKQQKIKYYLKTYNNPNVTFS